LTYYIVVMSQQCKQYSESIINVLHGEAYDLQPRLGLYLLTVLRQSYTVYFFYC